MEPWMWVVLIVIAVGGAIIAVMARRRRSSQAAPWRDTRVEAWPVDESRRPVVTPKRLTDTPSSEPAADRFQHVNPWRSKRDESVPSPGTSSNHGLDPVTAALIFPTVYGNMSESPRQDDFSQDSPHEYGHDHDDTPVDRQDAPNWPSPDSPATSGDTGYVPATDDASPSSTSSSDTYSPSPDPVSTPDPSPSSSGGYDAPGSSGGYDSGGGGYSSDTSSF